MTSSSGATTSQNVDYTHFISLPLSIHPEMVNKLINVQKSVLGTTEVNQDLGIEKSMFINPKTFHLTVVMLKLWNKDQFEAASEVMRSVSPKVIVALERRPVSIRLKGLESIDEKGPGTHTGGINRKGKSLVIHQIRLLEYGALGAFYLIECMRGSPAKAYVVYSRVEVIGGEARLLRACQVIINAFTEAGLVLERDANQKLKLHATIMNARHRKSKKKSERTDSFDARTIFGQYGSEEWGECLIREAHLSQRNLRLEIGSVAAKAYVQTPNM